MSIRIAEPGSGRADPPDSADPSVPADRSAQGARVAQGDRVDRRIRRLGVLIRRSRWAVLAGWVVLAAIATMLATGLGDVERDDSSADFLSAGAQSTQVLRLIESAQAESGSAATTSSVVVYREDAPLSGADLTVVDNVRNRLTAATDVPVVQTSAVQVSADGRAALIGLALSLPVVDEEAGPAAVTELRDIVGEALAGSGLASAVTGPAALDADNDAGSVDLPLLFTSMAIVALLLLATYRSPALCVLPLIASGAAVLVSRGIAFGFGEAGGAVTDLSVAVLIVLVFGASTDYGMLLLSRYRQELTLRGDHNEALAAAIYRSTPALSASAGTVAAGLLCLLLAGLLGFRGLGAVAAGGILVSLIAMLTLFPALLSLGGRAVFWPRPPVLGQDVAELTRPRRAPHGRHAHPLPPRAGVWARLAGLIRRVPVRCAAVVTLALVAGALGVLNLSTTADPVAKVSPTAESAVGEEVLARAFPQAVSSPLLVALPVGASADTTARAVQAATDSVDVVAVGAVSPISDRDTFTVTLGVDPYTAQGTAAIESLRANLANVDGGAAVGGLAPTLIDYRDAVVADTRLVVPAVLLVVAVILGLLLRSLVAPVMLLLTTVLSFATALGLSALVFDHVIGYPGTAADMYLFVFVFLVALGVDYNIFLMERIREERRLMSNTDAVVRGLVLTGGVITAAGLVLAGTFAALTLLPDVTVAQVGFAVAIGVLVDALVVRSVLVPALVVVLGDRTWWPGRPNPEPAPGHHRMVPAAAPAGRHLLTVEHRRPVPRLSDAEA